MKKRSFKHWSPRYVFDRLTEISYQHRFPEYPWLTADAVQFLQGWLLPTDIAVEFGSGRSTLWFAKRVSKLTSVENNVTWYGHIAGQIKAMGLDNVDYLFFDEDESTTEAALSNYTNVIKNIPDYSVDFSLVDGIYRGYCASKMVNKMRPGGLLVVDNANWFLPCDSRSPNSRTASQGPSDEYWKEFLESVSRWRCFWTTSGVTDTAFYFSPCKNSHSI